MRRRSSFLLPVSPLALAALGFWSSDVQATPTIYTNRAAFQAAVASLSHEGFESLVATDNNIAPSVTAPGFTVTMAPPGLGIYDHDETGAHATQGTKYLLPYRLSGAFDVTFTHTTPVNAVGFDITDYETGPSFPLTFSYSGGTFVAADASVNGATEFFGIIDRDQPVTPYVLHHPVAANGDGWGVDDVSSGIAPNLPGAPALPLLLAPLAALGWMVLRRRVRRSATL